MTRGWAAVVMGLGVFPTGLAWCAEEQFPHSFEVTHTERVNFASGGTIHLNGSYGYLSVDGWDQPQVELTVIKSTDRFYEPRQSEEANKRLDLIKVAIEHPSEKELAITTTRPLRGGFRVPPMPRTKEEAVTVELLIHAPNDSHLSIHHDNGYVWVSDMTGEIEATSHTGDMIVMLPDPGPYSIDAKTRMGSVSSDFVGHGIKQWVLGTRFVRPIEGNPHRVYLRMGRGSITIKQSPPLIARSSN